jgi:hypothetical protein
LHPPVPPLFAAFANPLMLWGLAGASLPIIIHLLNRRKFKEMRWAAMRFLLAAIRKNQKRVRIEQWLLLAIRTLILILLAMAMAKPVMEAVANLDVLGGGRRHWVLALDGSLSMDYNVADATRFDQAREIARRLVKDARAGDAFSVVLMADPPRAVVGAPAFSKDSVLKALDEVTLPHGGTDLPGSFRVIDEVLEASDIPRKELIVLTDLQRASWAADRAGADERLKRALERIDAKQARSLVIDLGSANAENRAVVSIETRPALVTTGATVAVGAKVHAFGGNFPGGRARLLVDGRLIAGEEQDLPPLRDGEDYDLDFRHAFAAPGDHVVEVRIDDDPLALDNRRRMVVPVRESVNVLLVDGDPKSGLFEGETAFLAEALSPEAESPGQSSPIQSRTILESQLTRTDLAAFDAVVLANVGQVSRDEATMLDAYLKQGGGLVIFTGDQVQADGYNRILFDGGKGLLPAEVGPIIGDPQRRENPYRFDLLGFAHSIIADFAGTTPPVMASLTNVKTFRYHRLTVPPDSGARVALKVGNDPLVVETRRHRGRVVMVGTGADREWTDWPIHQSYPAVMEKIVLLAASGRSEDRNVRVGQPLDLTLPASAAGAEVAVVWPDRDEAVRESEVQRRDMKLELDGDVSRVRFSPTTRSGTYRVEVGAPLGQVSRFAANPDPAESDPAKLDAEGLRKSLPGWRFDYDSDWRPLKQSASSVGQRGELHRPLLWLMLTLLFVESVLAWRFGHHASS